MICLVDPSEKSAAQVITKPVLERVLRAPTPVRDQSSSARLFDFERSRLESEKQGHLSFLASVESKQL